MKAICVYCSSSDAVETQYMELAAEMGRSLAHNTYALVYGGAKVGLMGVLARYTKENGGKVIGIMPELLVEKDLDFKGCDELFVTATMKERKAKMEDLANAFIALPGSFGTLEELFQVITLKQLGYHKKAIVILNHDGFYDNLLVFFEKMISLRFAKPVSRLLYHVSENVNDAISFIKDYEDKYVEDKWFASLDKQQPKLPGWAMPL